MTDKMIGWYNSKLDLLTEELKRIESGATPDYVQDKDLYGKEINSYQCYFINNQASP